MFEQESTQWGSYLMIGGGNMVRYTWLDDNDVSTENETRKVGIARQCRDQMCLLRHGTKVRFSSAFSDGAVKRYGVPVIQNLRWLSRCGPLMING